jgi:hypothetical protein
MVEVGQIYSFRAADYFFLVLAITYDYQEWHSRRYGCLPDHEDDDTFRVTTMRWDRTSGVTYLDEGWSLSVVEGSIRKGTWELIG